MGQLSVQEQIALKEVGLWEVGRKPSMPESPPSHSAGTPPTGSGHQIMPKSLASRRGPIFIRCGASGNRYDGLFRQSLPAGIGKAYLLPEQGTLDDALEMDFKTVFALMQKRNCLDADRS
jgi:hypothetical protein